VQTEERLRKWNRLTVLNTIQQLDNRLLEERDSLNSVLKNHTSNFKNLESFGRINLQEELVKHPIDLLLAKQSPIIFVFVVLFQCLLILPYWLTRKPQYRNIRTSSNKNEGMVVDL
jgi:hypothetical protein